MADANLCGYHTAIVEACIAHTKHMTKRARKRLRRNYADQCTPNGHCKTAATPQESR